MLGESTVDIVSPLSEQLLDGAIVHGTGPEPFFPLPTAAVSIPRVDPTTISADRVSNGHLQVSSSDDIRLDTIYYSENVWETTTGSVWQPQFPQIASGDLNSAIDTGSAARTFPGLVNRCSRNDGDRHHGVYLGPSMPTMSRERSGLFAAQPEGEECSRMTAVVMTADLYLVAIDGAVGDERQLTFEEFKRAAYQSQEIDTWSVVPWVPLLGTFHFPGGFSKHHLSVPDCPERSTQKLMQAFANNSKMFVKPLPCHIVSWRGERAPGTGPRSIDERGAMDDTAHGRRRRSNHDPRATTSCGQSRAMFLVRPSGIVGIVQETRPGGVLTGTRSAG